MLNQQNIILSLELYYVAAELQPHGIFWLTDRGATGPSIQKLYIHRAQKVSHGFKLRINAL